MKKLTLLRQQAGSVVVVLLLVIIFVLTLTLGFLIGNRVTSDSPSTSNAESSPSCQLVNGSIPTFCNAVSDKPVIYLYPPTTEPVTVKLGFKGTLTTTYPFYNPTTGWQVIAQPDGTLTNVTDGQQYDYLFWEGASNNLPIDTQTGFVVKGSNTAQFLQSSLSQLGLMPNEYHEFIVYWLPKLQGNAYNFIHFVGNEYNTVAPLTITPKPDSQLTVFMEYEPLNQPVNVKPEALPPFSRHGFTVVEWGGTELSH